MKPRKARKRAAIESKRDPYFKNLFKGIADGKTLLRFQKNATIFSQGDEADAVFFIESGKIKITVSFLGKEAVLAMLGPRSSLGEGCLLGQSFRIGTATAVQSTTVFRIERKTMLQALHAQRDLSEKFTAALLSRNIHLEENLCDQLFNHSEKRFACVLLKLARLGQQEIRSETKMPRVSPETLAEMAGTTRSRVTHFMNKFRTLGLIDYNGEITVRPELLTDVVLHD